MNALPVRSMSISIVLLVGMTTRAIAQCPTAIEQAKLMSPQAHAGYWFGTSVAIDGNTAVVGSQYDDASSGGSVYVFRRSGDVWTQEARLVSSGSRFGSSVDIRGDRLVAGASSTSGNNGSAYVFERSGTTWSQTATLLPLNDVPGIEGQFGASVSLDVDTIAVGAPCSGTHPNDFGCPGAVYVFARNGTSWNFVQRILYSGGEGYFGDAVALRGDVLVAGRPGESIFSNFGGEARVFRRNAGQWTLETMLQDPTTIFYNSFGASVAFDGERVVVGAASGNSPLGSGAAFVWVQSGGVWAFEAELVSADAAHADYQGASVAINGDTCIVGAPGHVDANANSGVAYVYRRISGVWTEVGKLHASDEIAGDFFGAPLAQRDSSLIVGVPYRANLGANTGAAYTFALTGDPLTYCTAQTNSQGCVPSITTTGTPGASSASLFTISAANMINNKSGIFFYSVHGRAAVPFGNGATLCVAAPFKRTPAHNSGGNSSGTDCSGVLSFDFNAWAQLGLDPSLTAGAIVNGQFWSRDPQSASATNMTGGIEFVLCP